MTVLGHVMAADVLFYPIKFLNPNNQVLNS
ncbi:hypothetical protein SAMN05444355_103149 [Flavobacterium frigoris]|uniref:Uncharacterized protein n=1 Tax=Flavobacterium frigoris TaxID=229204 RepID=A0A1H9HIS3_FLAFI|nr:hypothetical protein SAMN05444355_103149 [Flavobacterium frigoris]